MMKSKIVFLFLLLSSLNFVQAAVVFGVSPGNAEFRDVLKGGYSERFFRVVVDSEQPVLVKLSSWGEVSSWLNYPSNLTVSRKNPGRVLLSVRPPADVPNGNYTAFLRVETEPLGTTTSGGAVGQVLGVIDVALKIQVTDLEKMGCWGYAFSVNSVEKGEPLIFSMRVRNTGNIRIRPSFLAEVWDSSQTILVRTIELSGQEILPSREEEINFSISTKDFEFGQYWVETSLPDCYSSSTLTFDIFEPGALKAQGSLGRIYSKLWAQVGETIPIFATFTNTGEKTVSAKFVGQISREGKIVQVLESPLQDVAVKEEHNFTFFFTPEKIGRYVVSGRVLYDKKRTYESSTVINVSSSFNWKQGALIVVYLIILFAILFLAYKIRKEKRRFSSNV